MEDIVVKIYVKDGLLRLCAGEECAGSQYENRAKRLVFERPEEYAGDSLLLFFKDGAKRSFRTEIGDENVFEITNSLTETTSLDLQAGFRRGEKVIMLSDSLHFFLRPSIRDMKAKPGEWRTAGPIGPKGEPGKISVGKVITAGAGAGAEVVNSGTASEAILDFYIPKGDKGDKGDTGQQGIQGLQGPKGDKGEPGSLADILAHDGNPSAHSGEMAKKADITALTSRYITVYVNTDTGDDSNDGSTTAKAMKTIAGAVARYPLGNLVVILAPETNGDNIISGTIDVVNRNIALTGRNVNPTRMPKIVSALEGSASLFRLSNGLITMETCYVYLNDDNSFVTVDGRSQVVLGDHWPTGFYMTGEGAAAIIRIKNTDGWQGQTTGFLPVNAYNLSMYGQQGTLNLIGDTLAIQPYSRCPVLARLSAVTKDSRAFWYNGSDAAMSQINATPNYVMNW